MSRFVKGSPTYSSLIVRCERRRLSFSERVDVSIRTLIATTCSALITLSIGDESISAVRKGWQLFGAFNTPVISILIFGKTTRGTVGEVFGLVMAIIQTATIALMLASGFYSWLVRVPLLAYYVCLPLILFFLFFLFVLSPYTPVNPVALLSTVVVIVIPLRTTPFRSPPCDSLGVQFLATFVIGSLISLIVAALPLSSFATLRPLPNSAAISSLSDLQRARQLVASFLLDIYHPDLDAQSRASLARVARMHRAMFELRALVSRLEAARQPASIELLFVCQRAKAAELATWVEFLVTVLPHLSAMLEVLTRQINEGQQDDDIAHLEVVGPPMRALMATLAEAIAFVPNQQAAATTGTVDRASRGITDCLEAERRARAQTMMGPSLAASPSKLVLTHITRRDGLICYTLGFARKLISFYSIPNKPLPPLHIAWLSVVPLYHTWRFPLGKEWNVSAFLPPFRAGLAIVVAALWVCVDGMYTVTDRHGDWVAITVAITSAAPSLGDSFGICFDRVVAQVIACCYSLLVITVFTSDQDRLNRHVLIAYSTPFVLLCMLLRPEIRNGFMLANAAYTYFIILFVAPWEGNDSDRSEISAYVVSRISFSLIGVFTLLVIELSIFPSSPVHALEDISRDLLGKLSTALDTVVHVLAEDDADAPARLDAVQRTFSAQHATGVRLLPAASFEPFAHYVRSPPLAIASYQRLLQDEMARLAEHLALLTQTLMQWSETPKDDLRTNVELATHLKEIAPALETAHEMLVRHGLAARARQPLAWAGRLSSYIRGDRMALAVMDKALTAEIGIDTLSSLHALRPLQLRMETHWAEMVREGWAKRVKLGEIEGRNAFNDAQLHIVLVTGSGFMLHTLLGDVDKVAATLRAIVYGELEPYKSRASVMASQAEEGHVSSGEHKAIRQVNQFRCDQPDAGMARVAQEQPHPQQHLRILQSGSTCSPPSTLYTCPAGEREMHPAGELIIV